MTYLRDEFLIGKMNCNRDIVDEYLQALMSKDIKGMSDFKKDS